MLDEAGLGGAIYPQHFFRGCSEYYALVSGLDSVYHNLKEVMKK